jgi:dipeptidyl-peptidase 4
MRFFAIIILLLSTFYVSFGQKQLTLEDIWKKGTFASKNVADFEFRNDGKHYTKLDLNEIKQYDITTGEVDATLLRAQEVKLGSDYDKSIDDYSFSADESKILFSNGTEQIYRRSSRANFYVFDTKTLIFQNVFKEAKQRYATFSPDGKKIAFESRNNLYFKDLASEKVTQITSDGKANEIINGATDWVYEEEFTIIKGFEWSPDGKKIAYFRFDERAVPEYTLEYFKDGAYPEQYKYKYPKVGQPNACVSVFIYDLETGKSTKVNTDENADTYYPRMKWTQDPSKLCITKLNRLQNEITLLVADAKTGDTYNLYQEKNERYINMHDNLTFLKDGKHFLWTSESSGFNHIYIHEMSGRPLRNITSGDWEVTNFYGIDEAKGLLYYQSTERSPMQRQVYSIDLQGLNKKCLTDIDGVNDAQFSTTFDYFIRTASTLNSPAVYGVYDREGKLLRSLEENTRVKNLKADYSVVKADFFKFKTSEGVELNGWMMKPAKIKRKAKLPLLMYVYGGPGSQQVLDQWKGGNYWWFQYLVQQGFMVACVDNRGTGGRGEEFKKLTYKQLGKYETIDQIEAAKYLGLQKNVDAKRIAIFGWSYGGYMASSCMLKGGDVFKAGIAVAPVTNWKWYDSVYTERYMQTEKENAQGYKENSPVYFASGLQGKFLLMHGTTDDNVHFQNTAELANNLIANNKQFDTYFYPNKNHGISGGNTRLHLYQKMTDFLKNNLTN